MRAIIYTRVSSDTSGRGRSVEEQEIVCRQECERAGWVVAEVLIDNDIGASRFSAKDRPAYRKLANTLAAGDVLVTWEASRAQRDLAAYVQLRDLCAERGVMWSYSGKLFDLSRGDDRFATGLDALLAEKEVDQIRDRVLRAHRANAAAGRPHGQIPYGYQAQRDPDTGRIEQRVPHPEQAPIVREIARRIIAGDSVRSIAIDLNARGVPTAATSPSWRPGLMVQMIRRPTYAGIRTHRGTSVPGTWEALISLEEHRQLLAILSDPARVSHRGSKPTHLLTGIVRCGVCSEVMWRGKSNGASSYRCTENFCVSRLMEPVDLLVTEAIIARCEQVRSVDELTDPAVAAAAADARELRDRLEGFIDDAAEGKISRSAFMRIEQTLLPKIRAAERQAQAVVHPLVGELLGKNARANWEKMSVEDQRTVVRALVSVKILKAPSGRGFRPEFVRVDWN